MAQELQRLRERADAPLSGDFDATTCAEFVRELGDRVLERARTLFGYLAAGQVVDSIELASALGVTPRALSGHLTTPLKRRARSLNLPLPFDGGRGGESYGGISAPAVDMDPKRTHWKNRNGIAQRMLAALDAELAMRGRTTPRTANAERQL